MNRTLHLFALLAFAGAAHAQSATPVPSPPPAAAASTPPATKPSPIGKDGKKSFDELINRAIAGNFAKADQNRDGKVTRDEAKGKMPAVTNNFDQIDAAGTGSVTLAQVQAFLAERRERRAQEHRSKNTSPAAIGAPSPSTTTQH